MKKVYYIIVFSVLYFGGLKAQNVEKKQKEVEKKKELRKEDEAKQIEKAKKEHYLLQDKETRKRMKRSLRQAKRHNESKRQPFFVRWFKKHP